jgi:hypothetical protein
VITPNDQAFDQQKDVFARASQQAQGAVFDQQDDGMAMAAQETSSNKEMKGNLVTGINPG